MLCYTSTMDNKIHGNINGVRDSLLKQMESLYELHQGNGVFFSRELLESMAVFTGTLGREISVYISRSGRIQDVSIGDSNTVSLPNMRLVRNQDRLCGVRCIHTHPNGSGYLSAVDLGSLNTLRLDAMAAVGVKDGKPTSVYSAYVGELTEGERQPLIYGPMPYHRLPHKALLDAIVEADKRLKAPTYGVVEARPERAILVGIEGNGEYDSLDELEELAKTAGVEVVGRATQKKRSMDNATYIGSGKAEELKLTGNALEADLFLFDDELTALQIRNLENILQVPVIDRTNLILDIFAQRATTREGRLQVELAQQKYRLPRLLDNSISFTRQGAGVGMRGPGETKLEIDRRRIRRRIYELGEELKEVEKQRSLRRTARDKQGLPMIALVGYTNAGKSTLLNALSASDVLCEDKLFATLDPVVRQIALPNGTQVLLSDTVGFINKLPTELVEAFHSTLEEVVQADLILHVVDSSCPYYQSQMEVVEQVVSRLGAGNTPVLEVYNKQDRAEQLPVSRGEHVYISALKGENLNELLAKMEEMLSAGMQKVELLIPYSRYEAMRILRESGHILSEEHEHEGTRVTALLEQEELWKIKRALDKE